MSGTIESTAREGIESCLEMREALLWADCQSWLATVEEDQNREREVQAVAVLCQLSHAAGRTGRMVPERLHPSQTPGGRTHLVQRQWARCGMSPRSTESPPATPGTQTVPLQFATSDE